MLTVCFALPLSALTGIHRKQTLDNDKRGSDSESLKTSNNESRDGFSTSPSGIRSDLGRTQDGYGRAMSGIELLGRASTRTSVLDGSPTFRFERPREFTVDYEGVTVNDEGTKDGVTLRYFDNTKDEDYPGRTFINNKSFLDEAIALYQSNSEYLNNKNAWLPKEIERYAQDIARFFESDSIDVAKMKDQLESYVRQAANSGNTSADANNSTLTINGVDFSITQFKKAVDILNTTLKEAGDTGLNKTEVVEKMSQAANAELNQSQSELLMGTHENWSRYSEWASFYGHEEKSLTVPVNGSTDIIESANHQNGYILRPGNADYDELMSSLHRQGIKPVHSSEEIFANSIQKGIEMSTTTPYNVMKFSYEFSTTYKGPFITDGGKMVDTVTMNYVDRTKDEDCPGRFFINGKSFFDEAVKLYASDNDYLDHSSAWLPRDIKRYAQDVARFFGSDPENTSHFEWTRCR